MSIQKEIFGTDKNGKEVASYTVTNAAGTSMTVIEMGAALQSLCVADRGGKRADVVLGYDNLQQYESANYSYLGVVVGRSANRIKNGHFVIDGKEYQIEKNDGPNNLHSGRNGYHCRRWDSETISDERGEGVRFTLVSPDGDQGMPGELTLSASYLLTEDNRVILTYSGTADADTIVNPTNHSYFNLAGHDSGSICGQKVWIAAEEFTPSGPDLIPTGEFRKVAGTVMDFTTPKPIGQDIDAPELAGAGGYDHNYALKNNGRLELAASLTDEASGRHMDVYTMMPGMQFYTGNNLGAGVRGKDGAAYGRRGGVCFESQFIPDSVNNPAFTSPVVKADVPFEYVTVYQFSVK